MPFILIIALIAAGGGISYKAESAVPGDVLYAVKTHVDEPVQRFFSLSPEARITASSEQAGARLEEAQELASQGLLDTATKSSLDTAFKVRANETITGIHGLADSGDTAAAYDQATAFRKILETHQAGLVDAYKVQTDSASLAADISSSVSVALGSAESMQVANRNGGNIGAPEAGGPIGETDSSTASSTDDSTTTPDSIRSAILTLLSKVI